MGDHIKIYGKDHENDAGVVGFNGIFRIRLYPWSACRTQSGMLVAAILKNSRIETSNSSPQSLGRLGFI